MWGFFSTIGDFFGGLFSVITTSISLLVFGALLGLGCYIIAFFSSYLGTVKGALIAMAAGAVMLFGAHWSGVIDQMLDQAAKAKIKALEDANATLVLEVEAANKASTDTAAMLAEQNKAVAENAARKAKLGKELDKRKDDPNCELTPKEIELLNDIK